MTRQSFSSPTHTFFTGILAALASVLVACSGSSSSSLTINPIGANLTKISSDPYTDAPGQHATEVEPHMLAYGTTLVAAFQTGRIVDGGAIDTGWATSTDAGTTWAHGFLPGLTTGEGSGPYDSVSDPVVAYDAKHGVWMIASLPISNSSQTPAVVVNRSVDGGMTWSGPVSVDATSTNSDKNWIVCDNGASSPYLGHCYMEWDNPTGDGQILMSTSTDGGLTWSTPIPTVSNSFGIGGQPLVQPSGTVIVPIQTNNTKSVQEAAFISANGGASWSGLVIIANIQLHLDAARIRSGPLPSAAIDGAGTVWTVWEDCRFRANCAANDLVYSTSPDGITWSAVTRVPIDAVTSSADYFIPGIGVDPATSGSTAHVGLHYYYYSASDCTASTCQLNVGFVSSANGGSTWNAPVTLAGPMQMGWLPNSQNGLMVGDYIATAFINGVPHGVFAVATETSGTTFNEAMYTAQGLSISTTGQQYSSAGDKPLHHLSDKVERERPEKRPLPRSSRTRGSSLRQAR